MNRRKGKGEGKEGKRREKGMREGEERGRAEEREGGRREGG